MPLVRDRDRSRIEAVKTQEPVPPTIHEVKELGPGEAEPKPVSRAHLSLVVFARGYIHPVNHSGSLQIICNRLAADFLREVCTTGRVL